MFIKITGIIISMFILTNEVNAKSAILKNSEAISHLPTFDAKLGKQKPGKEIFKPYYDFSEYHPDGSHEWDVTIVPSDPNSGFIKRPYE